jgi:hypothetical protein
MWHHRQCTSNSTFLQMYYKISHILKSINIECFSHPSKVGQRRQMQSIKLYYHYIKGICIVSNENVYSSHIFLFRLFLESNPIPAKKALQLMGKIGYCSLGIYSESMYIHFRCVLSSSGPGIRPPLCEMSDEHVQSLTEALIIGKAI